jgi:hypothetical protein
MCFYIHPDQPNPKVATRSIRVWKRFRRDLTSPYQLFQYEHGKEYRSEMMAFPKFDGIRYLINRKVIEQGLHSYSSRIKAEYKGSFSRYEETIIECTVPKGSTYYWNPRSQEIVSDRLVIKAIKPTRPLKTYQSFPLAKWVR